MKTRITCEGNVVTFEKNVKLTERKLKAFNHLKNVDDIISRFERDLEMSICVKKKNNKTVLHFTKNCFLPITAKLLQSFENAVDQFIRFLNVWA